MVFRHKVGRNRHSFGKINAIIFTMKDKTSFGCRRIKKAKEELLKLLSFENSKSLLRGQIPEACCLWVRRARARSCARSCGGQAFLFHFLHPNS